MAFKDILAKLMTDRGIKAAELARLSGVTDASISEYLNGKKEPMGKQSILLAKALGVTLDVLWETEFAASDTVAKAAPSFINKKIPIVGRIAAGIPLFAEENFDGEVDIGDLNADFALEVIGDSMVYAGIFQGDYVLLKNALTARAGRIVAATVTDAYGEKSATLKYYISDHVHGYVLRSANPAYEDMPFTERHQIEGVFVGLVRHGEPTIKEVEALELEINQRNSRWNELVVEAISSGLDASDLEAMLVMMKKLKK